MLIHKETKKQKAKQEEKLALLRVKGETERESDAPSAF